VRRLGFLSLQSVVARLGVVFVLALVGLAVTSSGRAGEQHGGTDRAAEQRPDAQAPGSEREEVIDLSKLPAPTTGDRSGRPADRGERPAEDVSEDDLASIERQVRARSSDDAAAPDDGVSPGAPSDEEVRAELRQLRRAKSTLSGGPITRGSGNLVQPTDGQFTSPFGQRWGRLHAGIDLAAPTGTPIRAAAAGQVILMAPTGGYGNYTCIDHGNSVSTCYAHQSRFGTSRGAMVEQGEVVGYVGNTGHSFGAHLHFEVRINGRPVDPTDYL
jgi:murein DD-endopeptidase MepM/ murein hydrolase activator NlpD